MNSEPRSKTWTFTAGGSEHGITVDINDALTGGGSISVYTRNASPFAEAGTSIPLTELQEKPLPGPTIPEDIWREVHTFLRGDESTFSARIVCIPDGEVMERFSWEEGYDWEFYYTIEVYRNGVMFTASGEVERGIVPRSEFQLFGQPGGIVTPGFISTGGAYFQFERWLSEWNQLNKASNYSEKSISASC